MTDETRRRELSHLYNTVKMASNSVSNALTEADGAEVRAAIVEHLEIALFHLGEAHVDVWDAYTDEKRNND